MDPVEFLAVARRLSGSVDEAALRTSVGRSYYAVFNHLRLRLEPIKPFPGDVDDHKRAVYYLVGANNRDLQSIGQTLKDLRTSRNEADYRMNTVINQGQGRLALAKAEKAIEKSGRVSEATLTAAITALQTYPSR